MQFAKRLASRMIHKCIIQRELRQMTTLFGFRSKFAYIFLTDPRF
jgi:hypothetical protein